MALNIFYLENYDLLGSCRISSLSSLNSISNILDHHGRLATLTTIWEYPEFRLYLNPAASSFKLQVEVRIDHWLCALILEGDPGCRTFGV